MVCGDRFITVSDSVDNMLTGGLDSMTSSRIRWELTDNRGRRTGTDRRYFSYSCHIPERRCGKDRRSYKDKRTGSDIGLIESQLISTLDEKGEGIDSISTWN
jgi:hypothetical protein